MSTPPNELPDSFRRQRRGVGDDTTQDTDTDTQDVDRDDIDQIRERRGASREEMREAADEPEPEPAPEPVEQPPADSDIISRAAGQTQTPGDPAAETEQQVEQQLEERAVEQSDVFTDTSQVQATNVRQTDQGFQADIRPTQQGRQRFQEFTRETRQRTGTTGRTLFGEQQRQQQREQQEAFEADVATSPFARRQLERQIESEQGFEEGSVAVTPTGDGDISVGLTIGGESRQLVESAEQQGIPSEDVDVVGGGDGLQLQFTDEAFRERAAAQTEGVEARDLQTTEEFEVRPSDAGLFRRSGVDDIAVSPDAETGETERGVELTPEAEARRLSNQLEDQYPNADITIEFEGEGDDREPVATVRQEGVISGTARVLTGALEGAPMLSPGTGVGPADQREPRTVDEEMGEQSRAALENIGAATLEGGEAIVREFEAGLERDATTVAGVNLPFGRGGTDGFVAGPGAPGTTVSIETTQEVAAGAVDIGEDVAETAVETPGEFVEGGQEIAGELVSGVQRDVGTALDVFTSAETPVDPRFAVAAAPVAAPAGALGAGATGASLTAGATAAAPVAAGVGLGVGTVLAAQELEQQTAAERTITASELGIGAPVQNVRELGVGEQRPDSELEIAGSGVVASRIPIPDQVDITRGEIAVPESVDQSEVEITDEGDVLIPAEFASGASIVGVEEEGEEDEEDDEEEDEEDDEEEEQEVGEEEIRIELPEGSEFAPEEILAPEEQAGPVERGQQINEELEELLREQLEQQPGGGLGETADPEETEGEGVFPGFPGEAFEEGQGQEDAEEDTVVDAVFPRFERDGEGEEEEAQPETAGEQVLGTIAGGGAATPLLPFTGEREQEAEMAGQFEGVADRVADLAGVADAQADATASAQADATAQADAVAEATVTTDLFDQPATTQPDVTTPNVTVPGFGTPTTPGFDTPFRPGRPADPTRPRRPRDLDIPDFGGDTDDEDEPQGAPFAVAELTDFVDPLTGEVLETE